MTERVRALNENKNEKKENPMKKTVLSIMGYIDRSPKHQPSPPEKNGNGSFSEFFQPVKSSRSSETLKLFSKKQSLELAAFKQKFKKTSKFKLSETFDGLKNERSQFSEKLKLVTEKIKNRKNKKFKIANININEVSFEAKDAKNIEVNSIFNNEVDYDDNNSETEIKISSHKLIKSKKINDVLIPQLRKC